MTVPSNRVIVLLRVSTQKQGADGLGIAAQKRDIELFLQQHQDETVLNELIEVASGGKELKDRPVLQEAMDHCRRTNSTLLVAKLSRLSRDAAFVLTLMKDSSIQFCVASMPTADNFQLGIYALLNQQEREQIPLANHSTPPPITPLATPNRHYMLLASIWSPFWMLLS